MGTSTEELEELGQFTNAHYNTLQEALEHQNTLSNLKRIQSI